MKTGMSIEPMKLPLAEAVKTINDNSIVKNLGEIAISSSVPKFQFSSPELKAISQIGKDAVANLSAALNELAKSEMVRISAEISSTIGSWLQTIDFSPLQNIVKEIANTGLQISRNYKKLNKLYLQAMFEARWFPYAGWIADIDLFAEVNGILASSRPSKNRVKRIDKAIFSYYSKDELMNLKRKWRNQNLPKYMTRILVESIQAYNRREYALTVSSLSTLWEGIIQEKANDSSYRISRKTRENLTELIKDNRFDTIFSSFCEEFIFYDCHKPEEVKPDVPGRHGIAHCWYNTYPNRKVALNAILFTAFLIDIKPLDKQEENENG